MSDFSAWPLEALLREGGVVCPSCGRTHTTELKICLSGSGVVAQLPEVLSQLGAKKPFVVCDENTWKAAGERVVALLEKAGIAHKLFKLLGADIEPDEAAVGAITMAFDPTCDILLAVGSGVVNDLCKVVAHATGRRTMVVGTAPSMDGYASNSSSMHVYGVKTTLYEVCPTAILLDTDILKNAPMRMLWSGLGDMLAKYLSICEWRISHIVTGEYYCESIAQLVRRSLRKCVEHADKLPERDPAVIQAISEGLVLSGVAMSFANISRPASGLEHYFSHVWEMVAMEHGKKSDFHGIQVGVGTVLTLKIFDWLKTVTPDRQYALDKVAHFDRPAWEAMVKRIFGATAPRILAIEAAAGKNDPAKHARRLEAILANWAEIIAVVQAELPETASIVRLMRQIGMPVTPSDLGLTDKDAQDAFLGSREIRDKYMVSSLIWDIGLTDQAVALVKAD